VYRLSDVTFVLHDTIYCRVIHCCYYSQCKPLLKQEASGQATHTIQNRHAHNDTVAHNKLQQTATTSSRSSWSGSAVISPTITDATSTSKTSTESSACSTADAQCASDVVKDEKDSIQAVSTTQHTLYNIHCVDKL
jgi:hypothetical protein